MMLCWMVYHYTNHNAKTVSPLFRFQTTGFILSWNSGRILTSTPFTYIVSLPNIVPAIQKSTYAISFILNERQFKKSTLRTLINIFSSFCYNTIITTVQRLVFLDYLNINPLVVNVKFVLWEIWVNLT